MKLRIVVAVSAACSLFAAQAQNAGQVTDGSTFARQLAPTTPSQIVNPASVNPLVWTTTRVPALVPTNMGGFSAPNTSTSVLTTARGTGLTSLGNSAMQSCATFVPDVTSDPLRVQECAAVNFLTNRCTTPTTGEGAVMSRLGSTPVVDPHCAGTYGDATRTFGFGNSVTPVDPIFTVMNTLKTTAPAAVSQTCSPQTVVTTPAQFETNTCVKNGATNTEACSQFLNVTVVTSRTAARETGTCPTGTLVGNFCQSTASGPAQPHYVCPSGETLQGDQCIGHGTVTPAIVASYTCPSGQTLAGSVCMDQVNSDDGAAGTAYSCDPGATLSGTQCTASTAGAATYPYGQFCQDGYGHIPPVWSITDGTCKMQWGDDPDDVEYKAVDLPGGCPGLTDFVSMVAGIQINTIGVYRNGDCVFVTHPGAGACPIPDPSKWVLENVTVPAFDGYAYTSTGVCSYKPATQYSCPVGSTLDNNSPPQCHGGTTTTAIVSNYFCPTGGAYTNGQCITTSSASATVTYNCPTADSLVGDRCIKTTTITTAATPVYSCQAGYTLNGSSCTGPDSTVPATITYTCAAGAVLNGDMCTTTTTEPATIEYSCVDGSAPVAGFCVVKSAETSWTDTCNLFEISAGSMLPLP